MDRGIGPIDRAGDIPVFDGVAQTIGDMRLEVRGVADAMLPVASLPDPGFAFFAFTRCQKRRVGRSAHLPALRAHGTGEMMLDLAPALRKGIVAGWQRPDRVKVIWQNDHGIAYHRRVADGGDVGRAQIMNPVDEQFGGSVGQGNGEEIGCAGNARSAVTGHAATLRSPTLRYG